MKLKKEFERFGKVIAIEFSEKESRIAVVEYEDEKDAFSAKNKMNGMMLGDFKLDVIFNIKTPDKEKQIYVGGLHYDVRERDLDILFQEFGAVISVVLVPDKGTRRHKGYGFVEFGEKDCVLKACEKMNGTELYGRGIRVNPVGQKGDPSKNFQPRESQRDTYQREGYSRDNQSTGRAFTGMQKLVRARDENPTRCILLTNLVTPDQVDKKLEGEINDECTRYGIVEKNCYFPRKI